MFVDFHILNELGSPSINSNTFANRPPAGQIGRLFVSTDTFEIYRDNGTTWDLIGGPGSSTITGTGTATQVAYFTSSQAIGSSANLYWDNTAGSLGINTATPTAELDVHGTGVVAQFNTTSGTGNVNIALQRTGTSVWRIGDTYNGGANYLELHNIALAVDALQIAAATNKTSWQAQQTYTTGLARGNYFDYNLSVAAGGTFTSPNAISALGASLDLTLAGNATIPSGARSGLDAYNTINFTGTGTLTQSQAAYLRAYSNITAGWAFAGSATGTITHLAGIRVLFPDNSGSAVTVTNNYGLLINDQTANTGTVTYTNRWGVYQEGASDLNYLNANTLIGTTVNNGAKLQVSGTSTFSSTVTSSGEFYALNGYGLRSYSGSSASGDNIVYTSLVFSGWDGIYQSSGSTRNFGIWTNGGTISQPKFVILNGGNVGIGTSSPSQLLQINSASATSTVMLASNSAASSGVAFGVHSSGAGYIDVIQSNALFFATNDIERMRITSGGNVGIGVTTPSEKLDVGGNIIANSGNNAGYKLNGGLAIYRLIGDDLGFLTASTVRMAITNGGNVGINTLSPSGASGVTLAINGAAGQSRLALKNNTTGDASGDGLQIGTSGTAAFIEQRENDSLTFSTNAAERARFTAGGNFLIGTTTDGGFRLQVNGTTSGSVFRVNTTNGLSGYLLQQGDWLGTTATNLSIAAETGNGISFFTNGSATLRMVIKSTGVINIQNMPTSSAGLSAGDLWNNGGVVNIV